MFKPRAKLSKLQGVNGMKEQEDKENFYISERFKSTSPQPGCDAESENLDTELSKSNGQDDLNLD